MLLITISCSAIVLHYKDIRPAFPFLIFKICTDLLLFYFWQAYRDKQLYYYMNLGLGKRHLFSFALVLDISLFLLIEWCTALWI